MNGPFVTEGDDTVEDGEWQNALGTFPSIKARRWRCTQTVRGSSHRAQVGQSMYCSKMLEKNTITYHKQKERFRMFEHEPFGGRQDPGIATRVRFDDVVGDVFRLRDQQTKAPVFGSYSADVDGITPELAQRCNLCSMYGSPLGHTPIDPQCVTNDDKPLVRCLWSLCQSRWCSPGRRRCTSWAPAKTARRSPCTIQGSTPCSRGSRTRPCRTKPRWTFSSNRTSLI